MGKPKLVGGFGLGLNGILDLEGAVRISFSLQIITTDRFNYAMGCFIGWKRVLQFWSEESKTESI